MRRVFGRALSRGWHDARTDRSTADTAMSADEVQPLRVSVLGTLALSVEGRQVAVPGGKRRVTLALLALADGDDVATADLIDALWPDGPPVRAGAALQNHVSRLRSHLGPASDRLTSGEHSYRLLLRRGELDVHLARDALARARELVDHAPAEAAERLVAARGLWRGRPLAEFDDVLELAAHRVALDELRRGVDALLVKCALRIGDVDRALVASAAAVADDPLSEPLVRWRMEALAAAGRRADALSAASDLRRRLRDELGLDPTPELAEVERAIAAGVAPGGTHRAHGDAAVPSRRSIPTAATPLVGREAEVGAVWRLLDAERLVTIVGTGGVGKSRLAADLARRHDDAHWVSLAPLAAADDLPRTLAAALGLEAARGDVVDACAHLLRSGEQLLVLDNCEHVLAASREVVGRLLQMCPTLTVLAASRQRLGLPDECTFRLGPLALPDPTVASSELAPALALFLDRARRARPGFELAEGDRDAAVSVVRRLDGVPLAIELAAGRLSALGVADLRDRLDRALELLRGDRTASDARHQTLRATLAWSYDLLPADRQRLVRHMAVFPDGVDLAAAERIAADVGVTDDPAAALGHLVDASMLDPDFDGGPRYRMLDTLRTFGLQELDANDERDEAERRLLRWAEQLVAWVDATLHTADEPLADGRLRRELSNLRAAWVLAMRRDALDAAISIVVSLDDAAQWRDLPEVWSWARALAEHPGLVDHPRRAAALATASDFAWLQGDLAMATELATSAVACAHDEDGRARALIALSVAELSHGNFPAAAEMALLAAELTARPEHCRMVAALATGYAGDLDAAAAVNAMVVPPGGITQRAEWEYTAAELASIGGRHRDAEQHYRNAIELASSVGSSFVVGIASVGLLTVLRSTGRHADALHGYRDVLEYWQQAGNWIQAWTTLRNLASLLAELGDDDSARRLLDLADRAPDAPAVGASAWARPSLAPTTAASTATAPTRHEAMSLALGAIDRHSAATGRWR